MSDIFDKLSKLGVLPVIQINDSSLAVPLAKALLDGGICSAEITFRTDAAEESIRLIHEKYPEMIVCAGTVLTKEQADKAINAGASLIVSPGINPENVRYCQSKGYPVIPGVCTPSEVETALSLGLDTVKFFPAEAAGGVKMLKALHAPYRAVKYMPTGGINESNLDSYLAFDYVIACGGSWFVSPEIIENKRFDEVTAAAKRISEKVKNRGK